MEPVTLTTERLLMRPLGPGDAAAVFRACQDPDIPRWTPVPSPYTEAHAREWIGTTAPDGWRGDTIYTFGVFTHDGGHLVGTMALVHVENLARLRQAELGYWTAKEHRGRGLTVEAGREACRWGFTDLGVERIEWRAEAGNTASRAVALRIGFRMEGVARSSLLHNGTRRDAWSAALLPSDWDLPQSTPYLPHPHD